MIQLNMSFSDYFPLYVLQNIEFAVLYGQFLLVIYFIYSMAFLAFLVSLDSLFLVHFLLVFCIYV